MAVGFPAKTTFANGTTLPASDLNDLAGTLNLLRDCGRVVHSTGTQSIVGGVAVSVVTDFVQGGVTFDSGNGGGLRVASAGVYRVSARAVFSSGSGWRGSLDIRRWRAGASATVAIGTQYVGDVNYYYASVTDIAQLQADDIVTLYAIGAGAIIDGTSLTVERIG